MRRVEQFELIRRDYESGTSIHDIATKYRVHRPVGRQAIRSPIPPARKTPERDSPKLTEEIKGFIDGILLADKKIPRKQRHTAHRIWQRCVEETGSSAAETTIREYVSQRKRDLGLGFNVFVPQHHPAGAQGEVDIYEALVRFPEGLTKVNIVDARSEYSGHRFTPHTHARPRTRSSKR